MGFGFENYLAELSHILEVSDRRRNTPNLDRNRSESLCAGLWVSCRIFWAWVGPALGPNLVRRLPAGSLKVIGALLAQPSGFLIWETVDADPPSHRASPPPPAFYLQTFRRF